MKEEIEAKVKFAEIGVCGLSCRLCPNYHMHTQSQCLGCKSKDRIAVGCPFIACALRKKGIEFCWDCEEKRTCEKWKKHREAGKRYDSFKCYQTLEEDISFLEEYGAAEFEKQQKIKEQLLKRMLADYNEGRSKTYFCIAATVMKTEELQGALQKAETESGGLDIAGKSKELHRILDEIAESRGHSLKLRK